MRKLLRFLDHAGWVVAFVGLCVAFGYQVMQAAQHSTRPDTGSWICPILGNCGPPGTPNIGRW